MNLVIIFVLVSGVLQVYKWGWALDCITALGLWRFWLAIVTPNFHFISGLIYEFSFARFIPNIDRLYGDEVDSTRNIMSHSSPVICMRLSTGPKSIEAAVGVLGPQNPNRKGNW